MSGFLPSVPFSMIFEGDTVECEVSGLSRKEYLKLTKFLQEDDSGRMVIRFENALEFQEVMTDLLPGHVQKFRGLFDAEGVLIPFETVLDQTYFTNVVQGLVQAVFDASNLGPEEKKQSDEPSEPISKGLAPEVIE